ncbi:hypothetical protein [Nostoc sp.]
MLIRRIRWEWRDKGDKEDKGNNPCPILLYERLRQRRRSVQVSTSAQCSNT